eukprot:6349398-Pyramimonas_sp.AAC.1
MECHQRSVNRVATATQRQQRRASSECQRREVNGACDSVAPRRSVDNAGVNGAVSTAQCQQRSVKRAVSSAQRQQRSANGVVSAAQC